MTREITVNMYMTLDGYGVFAKYPGSDIAEPEPDDFWKEMWINMYPKVDTIVFGRRSYEGHAQVHAVSKRKATDPEYLYDYSRFLEKCKLVVLSNTLKEAAWGNSRLMKGDLSEIIEKLRKENGKDIIIEGGPALVHEVIKKGLGDYYRIFVMPVVHGSGPHYWGPMSKQETLRLISVKTMPYGEIILHYETVR
jgi:dihydrofolate reductase